MFVQNCKLDRNNVITISSQSSLKDALETMKSHDFTGLPVVDNEKYVGMITRTGIYEAFFQNGLDRDKFLSEKKVSELVFARGNIVKNEDVFETTLFSVDDLPFIAVQDDEGNFSGIVTRSVILEMFQACFGMKKKGVRVSFTAAEMEGRLARLAEIAHQFHENIISLATFDETDRFVRRIVMKVEKNDDMQAFLDKLEANGFRILSVNED